MKQKAHTYDWLVECLEEKEGYLEKWMFGCKAIYCYGQLSVVMADKEEPWRGLMFPCEKDQHDLVRAEFDYLVNHPILPKWFYLSESDDYFESRAQELIKRVARNDSRFGVVPEVKKRKRKKKKKKKT